MNFSLKDTALDYLRSFGGIPELSEDELAQEKLVHQTIKIDANDLLNIEPLLAEFVLEDPNQGEMEFREIIQTELRKIHQKFVQVHVKVELTSLPPNYNGGMVRKLQNLPPLSLPSLPFTFQAQLIGKSQKLMHTMTSRFSCANTECAAHHKKHIVDIPYPERSKSKMNERCFFCQSVMVEILEARQLSHYILADFRPRLSKEDARSEHFATFKVTTSPDYLALGETYSIIGKATGQDSFYECIHWSPLEISLSKFMGESKAELNEDLSRIMAMSQDCPWSFVNHLALNFGAHIAPRGMFHHLKLGILLSLAVSQPDPEEPNQLSLFAASLDATDFPINLLHYGLSLMDQKPPVIHAEASALTSHVFKKEKKVMAGSLLIAKDTVCYLGELTKYKKDALDCIKSALESGSVTTMSLQEDSNSQETYPIMATIWTHCSINATAAGKNRRPTSTSEKIRQFCQAMKPFIDVFGSIYICQEEERDTPSLIHHLFSQHDGSLLLDGGFHKGLKMLLNQVRGTSLEMEPEASLLLKRYFVASRRARANVGTKTTDMPLKGLQTLTSMAEAHAKLSLQSCKVSRFDAVAAIKLYEENLAVQCGSSFVKFGLENAQNYFEEMNQFWESLEDFIGSFVGDFTCEELQQHEAEE